MVRTITERADILFMDLSDASNEKDISAPFMNVWMARLFRESDV